MKKMNVKTQQLVTGLIILGIALGLCVYAIGEKQKRNTQKNALESLQTKVIVDTAKRQIQLEQDQSKQTNDTNKQITTQQTKIDDLYQVIGSHVMKSNYYQATAYCVASNRTGNTLELSCKDYP